MVSSPILLAYFVLVLTLIDNSVSMHPSFNPSHAGYWHRKHNPIEARTDALQEQIDNLETTFVLLLDEVIHLADAYGQIAEHVSKQPDNAVHEQIDKQLSEIIPKTCADALKPNESSGIRMIRTDRDERPYYVYCMQDPQHNGPAWTIVQHRIDGEINFYRDWQEYKTGFGFLEGEFFIGLDKLHQMTYTEQHEFFIELQDWEGKTISATYDSFAIGDEDELYAIKLLGNFDGDSDLLGRHAGQKFSTPDKDYDNDKYRHCAAVYKSAWWHGNCNDTTWNGVDMVNPINNEYHGTAFGLSQTKTNSGNAIKSSLMGVRPIKYKSNQMEMEMEKVQMKIEW